jgi:SAM-dependent methyltransferase
MRPDPLIAQYEAWMYPMPIEDLAAYAAAGGRDFSDPSRLRRKLWPRRIEPQQLEILVAGCGANQAAILAHANPQHRVVGIDLSEQAIANHERLQERHQLHNLQLQRLAVEDAASLGRRFDYIVSTGVLHHLADPVAGLRALREVLAPHGVISVMLYGRNRRAGVYMVQKALRALGAGRTAQDVALARDVVARLPAWHHARQYAEVAPDLAYDAGFVDTFLNARDRAYTVPEIFYLAQAAGLDFQAWLDGLHYSPSAAFPADAAIHERIHELPQREQWHVVDLLAQLTATHRFLLCHPDRDQRDFAPFDGDGWEAAVLHRHPDLVLTPGPDGTASLAREWHRLTLAGDALHAFQLIDGQRTAGQILAAVPDQERRDFAAAVFAQLAEWDHIHCELQAAQ